MCINVHTYIHIYRRIHTYTYIYIYIYIYIYLSLSRFLSLSLSLSVQPKFSKYLGVQEWKNAVFLMFNVFCGNAYVFFFLLLSLSDCALALSEHCKDAFFFDVFFFVIVTFCISFERTL
jgi:hypothetical protein